MNKTITVLGCGWLGLPLAVKLVASGWKVKGSKTTPAKLEMLAANNIDPYLVQLGDLSVVDNAFFDSEVLLINIPPGLRKRSEEAYLAEMDALLNRVKQGPVKYVVFISSTSVYPELNKVISSVNEVDENNALHKSELLFTQSPNFKTTIIRFAGLIGPGRDPSRFFAGKQGVPNGKAPVNLIHLDDCFGIIEAVLTQQQFGFTYHAAAPVHPEKQEFYTAAAKQAGLPLPGFIDELREWKVIDSSKLMQDLKYNWQNMLR